VKESQLKVESEHEEEIALTIPLPPPELGGNKRGHSKHKSKYVKKYRSEVKLLSKKAIMTLDKQIVKKLPFKVAVIDSRFYHSTNRRRDRDNLIHSLKSAFDGLVDAGIIEDDSNAFHLPPHKLIDKKTPRVELTVMNAEGFELVFMLKRKES
jgi:Holliday junction resolvase RusA-like endonuclease